MVFRSCGFVFPAHSPDNSFMGFIVETHNNETESMNVKRLNQALVYGKAEKMWQVIPIEI